ncbi:MAG TPA: hypothetical protein VD761_09735 [Solirubrobacterales bacterium]|nr:hypothetical protein [Solirubrobacterales bacterium]
MFDSKTKITHRLTDAADLLIDFATLGEYGLEPVGRTRQGCADPASTPAATRQRPAAPTTRASARSEHCSLAEESGLFQTRRRTRAGQPY